jgi:hypothetical protein
VTTIKPSLFLIAVTIAALSIFLLGGGIYDILEKPLLGIPVGSRIIFFYPGTVQEQTGYDSLFAMITYSFGLIGILFVYQSTKYAYRPRQALILVLIGAMFILLAYVSIENLIYLKISAGR